MDTSNNVCSLIESEFVNSSFSSDKTDTTQDSKNLETNELCNNKSVMAPPNPMLISVILHNVFQYQDFITLKQCRLVCKSWKDATSQYFKKFSICNPIEVEMTCVGRKVQLKVLGKTGFLKNEVFWQNYSVGGLPYDKMVLSGNMFTHFKDFDDENEDKIQNNFDCTTTAAKWLQNYGSELKGIQYRFVQQAIESPSNSPLQKILTSWCLNLEEIDFVKCIFISYLKLELKKDQLKHLKKFTFRDDFEGIIVRNTPFIDTRVIPQIETLFKAASKSLEHVEICVEQPRCAFSIVTALLKYGHNLKTLLWRNVLYIRDFKELITLSVQTQLKTLDLDCFLFAVPTISEDMYKIFKNYSGSLEILKIKGNIIEEWGAMAYLENSDSDDNEDEFEDFDYPLPNPNANIVQPPPEYLNFFQLKLPRMEKLKILEIKDIFHCRIGILSKFIQNLPNLKKLKLINVTYASDIRPLKPDGVLAVLLHYDEWNDNNEMSVDLPQNKLEELYLGGEILNMNGVINLARLFPRLKNLNAFISTDIVFAEIFKKFRLLQELHLRFRGILDMCWCESVLVFHLPEMHDLRKLHLHHDATYPFQLTEKSVAMGFKKAKNLRYAEFNNFSILTTERETILQHLEHFVSLHFEECVLTTPKFSSSYVYNHRRKDELIPKYEFQKSSFE